VDLVLLYSHSHIPCQPRDQPHVEAGDRCTMLNGDDYIDLCVHISEFEPSQKSNPFLFPQFEIVTEPEPDEPKVKERSETDRMKDFEKMSKKMSDIDISGKDEKELEKLAMAGKEKLLADKQFKVFKKRIAREPEQVSFHCILALLH